MFHFIVVLISKLWSTGLYIVKVNIHEIDVSAKYFDWKKCGIFFDIQIHYGSGSQPLIIRIPPNRHLSVNVTFCIPPRAPHLPPGVRIPQAENRFITGFEDISQDKNAKLLTHKTPFRQISGLLHDYIVNDLLNIINV